VGGPTVNTQAQAAEQQNQVQGQQYAQQQQQAALAGLAAWNKANPSPVSTAAPLQQPGAAAPATIGGGVIQAGAGAKPGAGTPPQQPQPGQAKPPPMPGQVGGQAPMPGAMSGAPASQANPLGGISPQQRQAIITALSAQGAR
jgi:hypothetical protein